MHIPPWLWYSILTLVAWGVVGILQKLSTNYISAESSLVWLVVGFLLLEPFFYPGSGVMHYSRINLSYAILSGLLNALGHGRSSPLSRSGGKAFHRCAAYCALSRRRHCARSLSSCMSLLPLCSGPESLVHLLPLCCSLHKAAARFRRSQRRLIGQHSSHCGCAGHADSLHRVAGIEVKSGVPGFMQHAEIEDVAAQIARASFQIRDQCSDIVGHEFESKRPVDIRRVIVTLQMHGDHLPRCGKHGQIRAGQRQPEASGERAEPGEAGVEGRRNSGSFVIANVTSGRATLRRSFVSPIVGYTDVCDSCSRTRHPKPSQCR